MQIKTFLKQNKHLAILFAVTIFFIFLPTLNLFLDKDFKWRGVETVAVSSQGVWSYYDARIREIVNGHPFIGNPYFLEHNNEIAPAFFLADWLAAIPRLLGASLGWGAIANLLFWSLLFVFLSYGILRELGVSKTVSVVGAELSYLQVFHLMATPVSMQTIFPFYLLFLFAFLFWVKDCASKKRTALLILASALSFYIYTYLWQIALTMLGLAGLYWLLMREKEKVLGLIKALVFIIIFSTPLFVFTYLQITHPYYWDTMQRIGFVPTHMPTAEVFYSGRWVILIVLSWFLSFWWSKELRANQTYKTSFIFVAISGLSLVIVSASNVITGKEMELAQHIIRFILAWASLALVAFLFFVKNNWAGFKSFNLCKKSILFVLCLTCFFGLAAYYRGYLDNLSLSHRRQIIQSIEDGRRPSAVLSWLESREKKPVVIWINGDLPIEGYITAATRHYVLFSNGGILQLVSSEEVEERYLVSNYFNKLSLDDIKNDFKLYAGSGNAVHPYKIHNRKVVLCRFFRLDKFGYNCGDKTDALTLKGEKYFTDLYDKYTKEIVPNIGYYLKKYHVAYFIKDRRVDKNIYAEKIGMERVYYDDNFEVYKIK